MIKHMHRICPLLILTTLAVESAIAQTTAPIEVGSRNQLFVDTLFFEKAESVTLNMHPAAKTDERTLVSDKPWENASLNWFSVLEDNGRYRMWYECYDVPGWPTLDDTSFCYAESGDGMHWTKPELGLFEYQGSSANNILFRQVGADNHKSRVHGTNVFLDPSAPPETRYKAVSQGQWTDLTPPHRIAGMCSPDGVHWSRLPVPICNVFADSQYSGFWDGDLGRYVLYGRVGGHGRAIGRAASETFERFEPLALVLETGENDPPDSDLYNPAALKYPHADRVHMMFPSMYNHKTDTLDIHLAVSRDGIHWSWPERGKPFVALGTDGSFDSGSLYMGQGMILAGNEVWQYYSGSPLKHEEAELDALSKPENRRVFSRIISRLDGFVSADADANGGYFITPPLKFKGRMLQLNYATGAYGEVRIGLLDAEGKPIAGRSTAECIPLAGDSTEGIIHWENGDELGIETDKTVRLQVTLRDASLFGFRFVE